MKETVKNDEIAESIVSMCPRLVSRKRRSFKAEGKAVVSFLGSGCGSDHIARAN